MLRDATLGEATFSTLCSCKLCTVAVAYKHYISLLSGESHNTNTVDIASYIIRVRYASIILKITLTSFQ
jgi:hypothetical protein